MRILSFIAAVTLCIGNVAPAQETPAPEAPATGAPAADAPAVVGADGLALGQDVTADGVGTYYSKEVFEDWDLRCVRAADGNDPCMLYQLLKDQSGNAVAEVSLFALPAGQQAAAGATIVTPLETLLTEDLHIQVDSGSAKRYPFSFCSVDGCVARVGFTTEELAALKAGVKATVTIVPVAAPDQTVNLSLSLKGFTAGYEAVSKLLK